MVTFELKGNGVYSNDMYMEHSMPPVDSLECDSFEEQENIPRIAEDDQAVIPELVNKSDYLAQENYSPEFKSFSLKFLMGLPVPMTLVQQETAKNFEMLQNMTNVKEQGYFLVPDLASQCWNDVEKESFLLGLYIFGKNLVQLKKFVGSRRMGDIQAYYYGKFYRTQEYSCWSDRRKITSRKCVVGQKLFTGVRQQELLSRILPILSDECKHAVREVSKMFEEGKMAFEEHVFSLKKLAGMNILVEAVGIGKGKHDLTRMALEPTRSHLGIPKRPEIPIGKACSSLTCKEIVKYLTGDYRLSKTRSNDLFWEAVWPRLLQKGWHSEKSAYVAGSKNTLVFLVPGTENSSRWNLQRGHHYFDSVSDVLKKVASEPRLIELDHEEENESKKNGEEELEWKNDKSEEDDGPTHSKHCYLQPRTPTRDTDGMRFTVVDTSLDDGKPYNIREWTFLSADLFKGVKFRNSIDSFYQDAPDVSADESDPDDIKYPVKDGNFTGYDLENAENTEQDMHEACLNHEIIPVDDNTVSKHCPDYKKKPKRVAKDNLENDAPVIKRRRRLTPRSHRKTSNVVTSTSSVVPVTEGVEIPKNIMQNSSEISVKPVLGSMAPCGSMIHDFVERVPSSDVSDHEKLSDSSGCSSVGNLHAISQPQEAPRVQYMIDLNLPPDFDTGCTVSEETRDHNEKTDASKRRSTRNRPLTTRALEALADGCLTVKSRRKDKEGSSRDNSNSRPSRRAQAEIDPSEYRNNDVAPNVQERQSGGSGVNASEIREFQAIPSENVYQFLPPCW